MALNKIGGGHFSAIAASSNAMDKTVSLLPFPPPPFPGKKGFIEPIMCEQLLQDEGLEMAHCVGSYAGAVQRGEVYVYKVCSLYEPPCPYGATLRAGSLMIFVGHLIKKYQLI